MCVAECEHVCVSGHMAACVWARMPVCVTLRRAEGMPACAREGTDLGTPGCEAGCVLGCVCDCEGPVSMSVGVMGFVLVGRRADTVV